MVLPSDLMIFRPYGGCRLNSTVKTELGHPENGVEESNGLPQRIHSEDRVRAYSWRVKVEGKKTVALGYLVTVPSPPFQGRHLAGS